MPTPQDFFMSWPLSQDFNEAVQNPATAFADPDLKAGTVSTNPMGMPIPRSGNYADVYQIVAGDKKWAVKCFTRPTSAGLAARYAAVSEHLAAANLPFTVGFSFLPEGVRVRGKWYPAVKMQWVDGFPINAFVRDNLNRSSILENMLTLWVKLCRRLRETGMAHGDIQHGNVLLVPAGGNSLGLKLVDYDGVFVPAVANQPTGEAGHASYQHPDRVATQLYSADLDRFPHLVVATALRGLLVGGRALWDKYDNGDNLLFTEKDFKDPGRSKLMRELWETGDPFTVGLVGHLALACTKPPHQTPWLDQLMPGGQPPILTPSQERQAADILGLTIAGPPPVVPPPPVLPTIAPQPAPPPVPVARAAAKSLTFDDDSEDGTGDLSEMARRPAGRRKEKPSLLPVALIGGVILAGIVGATVFLVGGKKQPDVVQKPPAENPPTEGPKPVEPVVNPPVEPVGKPPVEPVTRPPVEPPAENPPPPAAAGKGQLLWSRPVSDSPREPGRLGRFSLDGKRIISAAQNAPTVNVLDARTGAPVAAFREHEPPATIFPFPLPSGKVMSAAREPVLLVWDADTGRAVARAPWGRPIVGLTAVLADRVGKYAVLAKDDAAAVLDTETGREVVNLATVKAPFNSAACAIRPDGSAVLSVTPDYKLRVTALPSGKTVGERSVQGPKADKLGIVSAWSPDGKLAVLHEFDGQRLYTRVHVVAVETGEVVKELPGEYQIPAAFSGDGRRLVLAQNATAVWLDTATWDKAAEVAFGPTPAERVVDLDATADGSRVIVTTFQRTHYLVAFAGGGSTPTTGPRGSDVFQPLAVVAAGEVPLPPPAALAVDRTGTAYYAAAGATVSRIDVAAKKVTATYAPGGPVSRVWALPNDAVAYLWATAAGTGQVGVLDGQTLRPTGAGGLSLPGAGPPRHANVTPGSSLLSVVSADGRLSLYDLADDFRPLPPPRVEQAFTSSFLAADGKTAFSHINDQIVAHDLTGRGPARAYPLNAGRRQYAVEDVSADGRFVALRVLNDKATASYLFRSFEEWNRVASFSGPDAAADSAARYVGDGKAVVVTPTHARLIDARTANPLGTVNFKTPGQAPAVAVGGDVLAFANTARTVVLKTADGGPPATDGPPLPSRLTEAGVIAAADVQLDSVRRTAVSRDGKAVYFAADAEVVVVDAGTKAVRGRHAVPGRVRSLTATADGVVAEVQKTTDKVELHVLDGRGKLTGAGVVPVGGAEVPKHVSVAAGGTLATAVKPNGHIELYDLTAGKLFYTLHPDPPALSAFPTADGTTVIANCGKRLHNYLVAEKPKFRWMVPPGLEDTELVLEAVAPDGKAVVLRTPGPDGEGTKFVALTFARWKTPASIFAQRAGPNAAARFVGGGERLVVADGPRLTLYDASGRSLGGVSTAGLGTNPLPVASPGGEVVAFASGTGATIYRTTDGPGMAAADPPPVVPKRQPVPDAAALAAAEKTVKDTYAADYAKKPAADRRRLAERLYADGKESGKDAAAQYVMFKEAAAIAADVAEAGLLVKAVDATAETFDVDGFALKLAALEKLTTTPNAPSAGLKAAAEAVQELAEEAAGRDDYEPAIKLVGIAAAAYGRSGATAAQKETEQRLAQLRKQKDAFEAVKAAAEKLKADPADPAANAQVGRFRAFAQGRWDDAFKLLAIGSDAGLKKLAEMELKADNDLSDLKRGDLWRDYAATLPEGERSPATGRAKFWYAKALVSSAGLERAAAEKGLKFVSGGVEYWPGLVAQHFVPQVRKLKGQIDYGTDFAADASEFTDLGLRQVGAKWTGAIVAPTPGRYKIIAETLDTAQVLLGTKPDQKKVIEVLEKGPSAKEGYYSFGERPVAVAIEFGGYTRRGHGLKLKWLRPGAKAEEPIPASALFHAKAEEKLIDK